MFTKIYIDNIEGIENPITIDFISKSRNKSNNLSLYKTNDDIYINRLLGIIGGNSQR